MNIVKIFTISIFSCFLFGCANVSYHVGSVPSLSPEPKFNPDKTYSYYDDAVSKEFEFGKFEIMVLPYNSIKTSGHFELFWIPVEQHGSAEGSVGETPFKISVSVKGEKGTTKFLPYKTKLNDDLTVQQVKWRDPEPSCVYRYTDWSQLDFDTIHVVKDRLRNQNEKCMKPGWVEYLFEFNVKTPSPTTKFNLELSFQDVASKKLVNKKLYFSAAKFISTQTH